MYFLYSHTCLYLLVLACTCLYLLVLIGYGWVSEGLDLVLAFGVVVLNE